MRFTVLGPVRAWRGEAEIQLGPPKQRALLALLLVRTGQPVAVHEIVDVLWGEDPPDSAVNVVHRHVGALRRLLEPGLPSRSASRLLVRGSGGYRIDVGPDSLDLLRFRALRAEAGVLAESGEPAKSAGLLIEALALWRGPAAAGTAPQVRAHPVFVAVDREHPAVVKQASEMALAAGAGLTERVLVILRQAAAHHALDETLQARLILVLAATGHQAEALDVYQAVRSRLADELGLDPGPELRAAQQRVLRQSLSGPAGEGHADGVPAARSDDSGAGAVGRDSDEAPAVRAPYAPRVRPAQLPPDHPAFTGRRAELARSQALLPPDGAQLAPVVISTIGGMAGVGKTTLAVHWAHAIAHRFPDGQLYVNLRGFHATGSIMSPADAIRTLLDAFGLPPHRIPAGLDAQVALYRSLLAGRRVLVLLDNARDTEQVRPLLPGAPGCLAIVTSRNQLHGLIAGEGAHPVALGLPDEREAREFLVRRLGAERVAAEPQAADEIVALCGRLPLALAIACARAAVNPGFTLASVAAELRESHGSLAAFTGSDPVTDARSVFSWSYRTLSPGAARLFRLLALHPGPECSVNAAASLAGRPAAETRALLAELVMAQLLTEHAPGRFASHDLLRAYAAELAARHDADDRCGEARGRLLDHYLHSAHAADTLLAPHRERLTLAQPRPGADPERFPGQREALDWLESERTVLLTAVEQDARSEGGPHAWQLAATLELFLDRHGRWQEQLAMQSASVTSAQRLGDVRGQAHAHRAVGFVSGRLDRPEAAHEHLARALELFGEIGDLSGQGRVHRYLAFLANRAGRHTDALDHYRQARELYRATGWRSGEASIHNEVGWTHILLGSYDEALTQCRLSLALHQEIGDRNGEAAAWDSLGYAYHHLGRYEEALAGYAHALDLYREIRDGYLEADTLVHIGDSHAAAGDPDLAAAAWRPALDILNGFDHPDAEDITDKLRQLEASGAAAGDEAAAGRVS
ncbi:AfsR/SARP family transcriptional regulator [Streptomyces sp. NBC_00370]|uniref:AfsR/SARP family transcriptional regulator n=1 Tax=Streptomyces sp. NBC_00370 TaxID=2975728 RepID=UPI002E255939